MYIVHCECFEAGIYPVEFAWMEVRCKLNRLVVTVVSLFRLVLSEWAAMILSLKTIFGISQMNFLVLFKSL